MQKFKVTISARLYDQHHKFVHKYTPRPAHSFLAQFIEALHVQMAQSNTYITNTAGAELLQAPASNFPQCISAADAILQGIVIGSGTTPVDIDDYSLETQITTGFTVSLHTFALSYPTATSRRMSISRTFTNSDPSPIQIEEVGIYSAMPGDINYCLDRTLYSIAIPGSSSLELTYRIDVSV